MARTKKQRRQSHGSAWHWKQTDCWYYTLPGSKKRMPLFAEDGGRIRGKENGRLAELALARIKTAPASAGPPAAHEWIVARVCSEYLQSCERRRAAGTMSESHQRGAIAFLNDLCRYCGALPTSELKRGHFQAWLESHPSWKSQATHRSVIAIVLAAFNYCDQMFGVPNPLAGVKKPASTPRLESLSPENEQAMYGAVEQQFRDFLFAALHTGLRPFCELAKLTADDVEVGPRGMMWRIDSSKTKKIRKIPVLPEVAAVVRRLMETAPRGSGKPIFRNTQGKPWKRMTGVVRFLNLKKKLGWDQDPIKSRYSCYTCRHTFVHRMLSGYWNKGAGCSIETLAELIGDTPKVAYEHYGKEWSQHYQEPLWAAIGDAPKRVASQPTSKQSAPKPPKSKTARRRKPTAGE